MIVNEQKQIVFKNKCGCVVDENELRKAILWYTDKPVTRVKTIYLHGNYPAVSIYKEKIHVHRLLMMYWMKRRLNTNEYVHHLNENKLCALQSNLAVMIQQGHQRLHNKGKTLSDEHKQKISEANKSRKGIKYKKTVNIPLEELKFFLEKGYSINRISKHYKCDWTTVKSRINENPELIP